MNKYQEALDYINSVVILGMRHGKIKLIKSKAIIQELVDKETPIKPVKLKSYLNYKYQACPKCNTNVYLDDYDYYFDRCEECGQRIDWNCDD